MASGVYDKFMVKTETWSTINGVGVCGVGKLAISVARLVVLFMVNRVKTETLREHYQWCGGLWCGEAGDF